MTHCYIALGSNLQQPLQQVQSALQELDLLPDSAIVSASRWYQSPAIGPGHQPDYVNGVALMTTRLQPLVLLDQLQAIEQQHHRQRLEHWGPRTLDLDLLLYGDALIELPRLTVPHPRMTMRNFVLYPLHDITPQLILPAGQSLKDLLKQCPRGELKLVDTPYSPTITPAS